MRSPKNSTLLKVVPETCVCRRPFSSSSFSLCRRLVVSFVFFDVIAFGRRSPRFSRDTASLFFSRAGPFLYNDDGLPKQDVSRRPHSHNRKRVHVGDLRQNSRLELVVGAVQIESLRLFLGLRSRTRGLVRLERVEVLRRIGNEGGFGERRRRGQTTARGKGRGRDDKDGNGSTRLKNKEQIYI